MRPNMAVSSWRMVPIPRGKVGSKGARRKAFKCETNFHTIGKPMKFSLIRIRKIILFFSPSHRSSLES